MGGGGKGKEFRMFRVRGNPNNGGGFSWNACQLVALAFCFVSFVFRIHVFLHVEIMNLFFLDLAAFLTLLPDEICTTRLHRNAPMLLVYPPKQS